MKIYFYNSETGVYQGESFGTEIDVHGRDGVTTVPPPAYGKGTIPVFDTQRKLWTVVALAKVKESNTGNAPAK